MDAKVPEVSAKLAQNSQSSCQRLEHTIARTRRKCAVEKLGEKSRYGLRFLAN